MPIATIPAALDALRAGKPVIVADDAGRENEGDLILAASLATPEWLAWTIRMSSGYLCAPMTNELADRLELPVMVPDNQDPLGTNYTVSVDAADRLSTGISASDRAHTLRVLADPAATPASLNRPGHILPLRARDGGVRERPGHTEATVDLLRLAGLPPVGAIGELVADDGEMMRMPGLLALGEEKGLPVITIPQLIEHLQATEGPLPLAAEAGAAPVAGSTAAPQSQLAPQAAGIDRVLPQAAPSAPDSSVAFEVETTVPTTHGPFRMRAYRDLVTGADHLAIISGDPAAHGALVRVHSECLTGEAFGSLKCECGPQLDAALDTIQADGGVVVYLRGHEGRGIGLINKLRAYKLQEEGLDTLDANLALGLPADARDYTAASDILRDLGVDSVRLLTNNPEKVRQLEAHGIAIEERVPLVVGVGALNARYLETKRDRMGHQIALDDRLQPSTAGATTTAASAAIPTEGHDA